LFFYLCNSTLFIVFCYNKKFFFEKILDKEQKFTQKLNHTCKKKLNPINTQRIRQSKRLIIPKTKRKIANFKHYYHNKHLNISNLGIFNSNFTKINEKHS